MPGQAVGTENDAGDSGQRQNRVEIAQRGDQNHRVQHQRQRGVDAALLVIDQHHQHHSDHAGDARIEARPDRIRAAQLLFLPADPVGRLKPDGDGAHCCVRLGVDLLDLPGRVVRYPQLTAIKGQRNGSIADGNGPANFGRGFHRSNEW